MFMMFSPLGGKETQVHLPRQCLVPPTPTPADGIVYASFIRRINGGDMPAFPYRGNRPDAGLRAASTRGDTFWNAGFRWSTGLLTPRRAGLIFGRADAMIKKI